MSMYTEDYLSVNRARGIGRGLTPGTFLAYSLRGRAKSFSHRYERALLNSLLRMEREGRVIRARSAHGRVAWYPSES